MIEKAYSNFDKMLLPFVDLFRCVDAKRITCNCNLQHILNFVTTLLLKFRPSFQYMNNMANFIEFMTLYLVSVHYEIDLKSTWNRTEKRSEIFPFSERRGNSFGEYAKSSSSFSRNCTRQSTSSTNELHIFYTV